MVIISWTTDVSNFQFIFNICLADTSVHDIEERFNAFLNRSDIAIILINQNYAELIRHAIDNHSKPIPAILEIPSKDCPYDPNKDSILRRAKVGLEKPRSRLNPEQNFNISFSLVWCWISLYCFQGCMGMEGGRIRCNVVKFKGHSPL